MRGVADKPRAHIYLDATFQTVWGDGANGTDAYFDLHPPPGRPVVVPAFGRIFGRQDVQAGQYVDQVAVRIIF
jgi:spore coat protein U-like protein